VADRIRAASNSVADWGARLDLCVEAISGSYREQHDLHEVLFRHGGHVSASHQATHALVLQAISDLRGRRIEAVNSDSAGRMPATPWRPAPADLEAARGKVIPDVAAPGLRVLFSGINPGLYSAATGHHFARPGNRFWPALHRSGFTPRQFRPDEQDELLRLGLGITNVAARATARADELTDTELRDGWRILAAKVTTLAPRFLAVVGVTAYRVAFGRRDAVVGPQDDRIGETRLWVLPNPSGLNAHWPAARLNEAFGELRTAVADF
jgi:double-stranded uracil-DNA glycosylase